MASPVRSSPLRVLVSGAGIGGPVLAYWLSKAGVAVTVVERAQQLRKEGQTVDIREEGITVIKWMGVEEAVKERTTKEKGVKFVDANNRTRAAFPMQEGADSFTSEVEIVRGELAMVFYQASQNRVEYIFGDTIATIDDNEQGVSVQFVKDRTIRQFDILVVAEGLSSRTRAKAFKEDVRKPIVSLSQWSASFSYPKGESDEEWARWYNAPNRRAILTRPDGFGRVRASVIWMDSSEKTRSVASSQTKPADQKEYFVSLFKGAGWESEKIMDALAKSDDFYIQETAQAKCSAWSTGRVVLTGDSAFCPSFLTGRGTSAAIVGAYVLAAEIVKHKDDYRAAFTAYESFLRPWITNIQKLPPGVPGIANPETAFGIHVFHSVLALVSYLSNSRLTRFLSRITPRFSSEKKQLPLPDPALFEKEG